MFVWFCAFCVLLVLYGYINKEDQFGYKTNKLGKLLLDCVFPRLSIIMSFFTANKTKKVDQNTDQIQLRKRASQYDDSDEVAQYMADFTNSGVKKNNNNNNNKKSIGNMLYNYIVLVILVSLVAGTVVCVLGFLYQIAYIYFEQREVYAYYKGVLNSCALNGLDPALHPECPKARIELTFWPVFRTFGTLFKGLFSLIENIGLFSFLIVVGVVVFYFYLQYKVLYSRTVEAIKRAKKIK